MHLYDWTRRISALVHLGVWGPPVTFLCAQLVIGSTPSTSTVIQIVLVLILLSFTSTYTFAKDCHIEMENLTFRESRPSMILRRLNSR